MSGTQIELNELDRTINVRDLLIRSQELFEYFHGFEPTQYEEKLIEILEFGIKGLKSFLTENYGRVIDQHFNAGVLDLDSRINSKIAEFGEKTLTEFSRQFNEKRDSLIKVIGESESKLDKDVLQVFVKNLKDDVFVSFKNDFTKVAQELRDSLIKYVTEKEIVEETAKKGQQFEEYIYSQAESVGGTFGDSADHIGVDNNTGDILIENTLENLRFCIEVKDKDMSGSKPAVMAIFEDMERERSVNHSMIVFRHSGQVPKAIGSFQVFGRNRLIVAISDNLEEKVNPFQFSIAYRIIRFLASFQKSLEKSFDSTDIHGHCDNIRTTLNTISSLKGKVTIFSDDIKSDIDVLKGRVLTEVLEIEEILKR